MHEVGVAREILEISLANMKEYGLSRLQRVSVTIGNLQCLDDDCLRFAFKASAAGTPAGNAELEIVRIQPKAVCPACGKEFFGSDVPCGCPGGCASGLNLLQGDELFVNEIEGV